MGDAIETVIGFDYGTSWIGVAVGQTLTRQARPLAALRFGDWNGIGQVIDEWRPGQLVVGLPLNMKGERQDMSRHAEKFARRLEGRFNIPAALVDERLTTREAYTRAIESGSRKSKREIDSLSAVLITESWLRDYQS